MIRWERLDTARVPDDGGDLLLYRRGDEFSIRVRRQGELMNSRMHGSEDRLGTLACDALAARERARVLIGGLGMGFTLAAALTRLAPDARVVVAELVPDVVRWNEDLLGGCAGHPLRDDRVQVQVADVGELLREAPDAYDAVLLDVDNGPEGLSRASNDRLYACAGLAEAHRALRERGVLAVWSAGPDAAFSARLAAVGFRVAVHRVRAHAGKGARHVIWIATRGEAGPGSGSGAPTPAPAAPTGRRRTRARRTRRRARG